MGKEVLTASHWHRPPELQASEQEPADILYGIRPLRPCAGEQDGEKLRQAQEGRDCEEGSFSGDAIHTTSAGFLLLIIY